LRIPATPAPGNCEKLQSGLAREAEAMSAAFSSAKIEATLVQPRQYAPSFPGK
jgi:hypothetical protein